LQPTDLLHFVELDEFGEEWEALGLDVARDLWALQNLIMSNPESGKVIKGTGGLRKIRFAPPLWNIGKRGAIRVCYVYFPEHWLILLVTVYGKNEKDDLTSDDKDGIRRYIKKIESYLAGDSNR
jgi:hypothetical protein